MLHFGEQLKTVRQARGYSLEYIEETTGISRIYLQSLEEGCYEFLPEEAYCVEIVRKYAAIIGINVADASNDFHISYGKYLTGSEIARQEPTCRESTPGDGWHLPARLKAFIDFDSFSGSGAIRSLSGLKGFKGISSFKVFLGFKGLNKIPLRNYAAAGLFLILVLWLGSAFIVPLVSSQASAWLDGSLSPGRTGYSLARSDELKQLQPSRGEDSKSSLATGTALAAEQSRPEAVPSTITLKLLAEQDCWLKTTVDGKEHFEGILPKGQSMTMTARDVIKLKTSSAGSLSVSFNGESLKPLGEVNEVIEKEFR